MRLVVCGVCDDLRREPANSHGGEDDKEDHGLQRDQEKDGSHGSSLRMRGGAERAGSSS